MNILPSYLRMSHLQNIIDQSPMSDHARRAREMQASMTQLRVEPGHEPDPYAVQPQVEIEQEEV